MFRGNGKWRRGLNFDSACFLSLSREQGAASYVEVLTNHRHNHTAETSILRCRAILFDMDGTLVDSTAVIHRTWKWWAEKHALSLEPILAAERGRPNREVLQQFGPHLDTDEESRLFLAAEKNDTAGLTVIPGSYEAVRAAQEGRWAIVTSAEKSLAEARLKAVGLAIPEVLITADMIRHGKPDPECYLMAAQRLDVDPGECVVFEDSPSGLLSARNAGMPVIAIGPFVSGHEAAALCIRDFTEASIASDAQDAFEIRVGLS